jgi:hypothetical protein
VVEGATLREHLLSAWERTGKQPDRLRDAPSLPEGTAPLWRDFLALHGCRGSSGMGPLRISWMDLDAYQRVQGIRFAPWEIEALRRADNAFMIHHAEGVKKSSG